MPIERERKFLARYHGPHAAEPMLQAYLSSPDAEVSVRVRVYPDRGEMTAKGAADRTKGSLERAEEEVGIPRDSAVRLAAMAPASLRKERVCAGRYDIDRFLGDLDGLVLAEFEHEEGDAAVPDGPDGLELGPEVTADPRFENEALAWLSPEERRRLVREVRKRWAAEGAEG